MQSLIEMDISVVIPLYNEEESLPELYTWIQRVMHEHHFSYEVIFVDDGSSDASWRVIQSLAQSDPEHVRGASFRRNYGKSPALNTGFRMARGKVVITMDADLQDSPDEIPELYRMITEDGYDLVSGFKKNAMIHCRRRFPQSCSMQRRVVLVESGIFMISTAVSRHIVLLW